MDLDLSWIISGIVHMNPKIAQSINMTINMTIGTMIE
jgi:hypothetical protein